MGIVSTRGILLRSHDYSDSSQILRFMTDSLGLIGVIARGSKGRSSRGGEAFRTFGTGELTAYVKPGRDLQHLKEFSIERPRRALGTSVLRLAAASVLAETVLRHAGEAEASTLFEALDEALDRICDAEELELPSELLASGWQIVSELGYHPEVDRCVTCGREVDADGVVRFDLDAGGVRCEECSSSAGSGIGPRVGPRARSEIVQLVSGERIHLSHPRAHLKLLGDFIVYHVTAGRPLESFTFFTNALESVLQ